MLSRHGSPSFTRMGLLFFVFCWGGAVDRDLDDVVPLINGGPIHLPVVMFFFWEGEREEGGEV